MPWAAYGPFTGSGLVPVTDPWNGLTRVHLSDLTGALPFGLIAAQQRYARTGWVAPYDFQSTPDGGWSGTTDPIMGPTLWLSFPWMEVDWTLFYTTIAGIYGLAYSLFPSVAMEFWVFHP